MNIFSAILLAATVFAGHAHGLACENFNFQNSGLSVMGHEPLIFTGRCFEDCAATIKCVYFDKHTNGTANVETKTGRVDASLFAPPRAICYSPYLYTTGKLDVQVYLVTPNQPEELITTVTVDVIQSEPAVFIGLNGGNVQVTHDDLTKIAVTSDIKEVDVFLVGYDPDNRVFKDLVEISKNVRYEPNVPKSFGRPEIDRLQWGQATLATTFVTIAVRPSSLNHGSPHPFHPDAAAFSAFIPVLKMYPELEPKFKMGVCKAWYYNQDRINPIHMPFACSADEASVDSALFEPKRYERYSAVNGHASLTKTSSRTVYELLKPVGNDGRGQECIYENGNLVSQREQGAGTAQIHSSFLNEREHFYEDEVSWYACCHGVQGSETCGNYYEVRRSYAK